MLISIRFSLFLGALLVLLFFLQTKIIVKGRDNINEWKSIYAIETKNRTLDDAIKNASKWSIDIPQ